jgi:hypothetical protein
MSLELSSRMIRGLTWGLMAPPLLVAFDFFARSSPSDEFYSTVAQVIAAMYLATALEYFTAGGVTLDTVDRWEFCVLLAISWAGMMACTRGVVVDGEAWTAGLGAMGLVASALLVTSNLAKRVSLHNPKLVGLVGYVICLSSLVLLIIPRAN